MRKTALQHLSLTHDSAKLAGFAELYADVMYNVALGKDFKQVTP